MLIHRALNMGCHQGLYICLVIEHPFRKDLQVEQSFIVCSTYYLWCSTEFNFQVIFLFSVYISFSTRKNHRLPSGVFLYCSTDNCAAMQQCTVQTTSSSPMTRLCQHMEEVQQITDWCRTKNLSLNVDKTKEMIESTERSLST